MNNENLFHPGFFAQFAQEGSRKMRRWIRCIGRWFRTWCPGGLRSREIHLKDVDRSFQASRGGDSAQGRASHKWSHFSLISLMVEYPFPRKGNKVQVQVSCTREFIPPMCFLFFPTF